VTAWWSVISTISLSNTRSAGLVIASTAEIAMEIAMVAFVCYLVYTYQTEPRAEFADICGRIGLKEA
jgi:hypothetical protein